MEITVEQKDRYTLVTLRGRIVSGEAPAVSAKLRAEMAQLHYRFVIDMANATFVSATFLRLIIAV
ncbi:STAS domain-containing protein, partial [candidate division WWE3 bacterium]|nr:STAS domain-containing protein [candidate division WWE3 bacterium]